MEVPRYLQSLVCTFLGHGARELAKELLPLGEFDMSLLDSL